MPGKSLPLCSDPRCLWPTALNFNFCSLFRQQIAEHMCLSAWKIGISTYKAEKHLFHTEKLRIRMFIKEISWFSCLFVFPLFCFFFFFLAMAVSQHCAHNALRVSTVTPFKARHLSALQVFFQQWQGTARDSKASMTPSLRAEASLMDKEHRATAPSREGRDVHK